MNEAATEEPSDEVEPAKRRRPAVRIAVGVAIAAIAGSVILSSAGGFSQAADAIRDLSPEWLAIAAATVILRFGLYSLQISWLGRRSAPMSYATAAGVSLVVFGFGAVTPAAPAEGLAMARPLLRRRGFAPRSAQLTLGFSQWFSQRSFYAVTALDLLLVILAGHLDARDFWPVVVASLVVVAALAATAVLARRPSTAARAAVLLGALRLRKMRRPVDDRRQSGIAWHADAMKVVGSPANRVRLALVSASANLADAATLWAVLEAAGIHLHLGLVVLATTVGTMASWVPLLPAGVGVVEAVIPAILHRFGAPTAAALASTLVYRALAMLAPAVIGLVAAAVMRTRRHPMVPADS